jgi:anti-anti-sigma factor
LFEVTLAPLAARDAAIVHVVGEIDMSVAGRFDTTLVRAASQYKGVVIDLARVSFFSAAGIRCIEHAEEVLDTGPDALVLVCSGHHHPVCALLRAAELGKRWPIFPALTAALDGLPPDR